jgi:hypothetical protein
MPPGSCRVIDELLRTQATFGSGQPVVFYPTSHVNYVGYSMLQLDTYAFRAAELYMSDISARKSSSEEPLVVGVLGVSNLDYIITLLALTKLVHTVMLLSPRLTQTKMSITLKGHKCNARCLPIAFPREHM